MEAKESNQVEKGKRGPAKTGGATDRRHKT